MTGRGIAAVALLVTVGSVQVAVAQDTRISERVQFLQLVQGKTLTRTLVSLRVTPDGTISGKGAAWDVTGQWKWEDGYFCRDLNWGGDALGYNCQEVTARGNAIRFTSDRGTGDSAEFRLR
ncbi:dihydrodipicolinate reductase [Puniceibacterium confluentis]|uniref:dihydrodipicolinate reductase n=1 Tax=Puniceibacterium confluentis TaxID=1958944 RepID=UPI0011B3F59F|nr:dihydrodipicolinate reductase [Puniceibacterium confluentis]